MSKKSKPSGYTGALSEIILLSDPFKESRKIGSSLLVYTGTMQSREERETRDARLAKLPFLLDHYNIPINAPDCWQQLALALASQHVPGFKTKRKTGAPRVETVELLSRLYHFFERKKNEKTTVRKRSDIEICKIIMKDPEFSRQFFDLAGISEKRLQNLVVEAKSLPPNIRIPEHPSPEYLKYGQPTKPPESK